MKIRILPESLARRIAAGEVVERPASVVKELVENALDAGAKEISVRVEGSGVSLIRVSDDGEGILAEDLPLAVERHSTSKLVDEAQLFCISTLGFRGEALPSIASVSRLEIVSRARGGRTGARLRVEGGKKFPLEEAGCPEGTTVEVRDLFFNTPARRKFLKSPATELGHIVDAVSRMALAHADVHFSLYHSGRQLLDCVAVSELEDRLRQVLGSDVAQSMARFSWSRGKLKVGGFLSVAPSSFPSTRYLLTYVNRRFVRDRLLNHAVLHGYETLLMKGRYPAVVLQVDLPYGEVDVNVHPAKYEVRFRRQTEVHDAVVEAIRESLKAEAARAPSEGKKEIGFPAVKEHPEIYSGPGLGTQPELRGTAEGQGKESGQGFFSRFEILGQLLDCYLVCGSSRGLVLIDQHAAHERIAFERMRRELDRQKIERQSLLITQQVELPAVEARVLEENLSLLERLGFAVEPFGRRTFVISAVPALLPLGDYRAALRGMAAALAEVGGSSELRRGLEERLMTIACHSAIRANRRLDREEMRALLEDLDHVDFATQCPHGRPVVLELTRAELERMFKRT